MTSDEDPLAIVRELTGGLGVDVAIKAVGVHGKPVTLQSGCGPVT